MKRRIYKKVLLSIAAALAVGYIALIFANSEYYEPMLNQPQDNQRTIAVLGATGTIGDGLLKAAIDDPGTTKVHVITRRATPSIDAAVESGKAIVTTHMDYLDYASIHNILAEVDAVYWAIGLSAVGLDEETYRRIHTEFPMQFVTEWLAASGKERLSFHYVSGSGADAKLHDSRCSSRRSSQCAIQPQPDSRKITRRPGWRSRTPPQVSERQAICCSWGCEQAWRKRKLS